MQRQCYLLKRGFHLDVDGSTRVCCLSQNDFPLNQWLENTRESLLNDDWVNNNCHKCFDLESKGLTSMRHHINSQFQENDNVSYIDIRYSNKCNMACAMCSSDYSSLWANLKKKTNPKTQDQQIISNRIISNVSENDDIFLHFAGGEPLLINEHFNIFKRLKAAGHPRRKMSLQITTNLSVLPKEAIEMFTAADFVRVCASIDAVGDIFNYIRYPGRFDTIKENLSKLMSFTNMEIVIQPTLSLLNIFSFSDLIHFVSDMSKLSRNSIYLVPHPLVTPSLLNVFQMPPILFDKIRDTAEQICDEMDNSEWNQQTRSLLEGVRKSTVNEDVEVNEIKTFLENIDKVRGSDIKKLNPLLYNILEMS